MQMEKYTHYIVFAPIKKIKATVQVGFTMCAIFGHIKNHNPDTRSVKSTNIPKDLYSVIKH